MMFEFFPTPPPQVPVDVWFAELQDVIYGFTEGEFDMCDRGDKDFWRRCYDNGLTPEQALDACFFTAPDGSVLDGDLFTKLYPDK
jgi:hypothetical protein